MNEKFKECLETIIEFKETGNNLILTKKEETGYKMINFMKKAMRTLTCEFPNIIINKVEYDMALPPDHWDLSAKHRVDVNVIIKDHYSDLSQFYKDPQIRLLMEKMKAMTGDVNELAQNTLFYAPVEQKTKQRASPEAASGSAESRGSAAAGSFKYSAFDLDLTALLFNFYFLTTLMDLMAFQNDKDIIGLPLRQLEESSTTEEDEESFMTKANQMDILVGNQMDFAEKIASLIVAFTTLICKDKRAIDYNYKSLMDLLLRSKVKEKTEITDYLKKMTVEEREVEDLFKGNKLGRWSKGEQKGFRTYQGKTYDEERAAEEQLKLTELQQNKGGVTDLDMEATDANQDREDNTIFYRGEDGEDETGEPDDNAEPDNYGDQN
jgi:hypothetical protein